MDNFGLITLNEFAKRLNKKESTIRTWKLRGQIPANCFKTIGSSVFVKVKEMENFLNDSIQEQ